MRVLPEDVSSCILSVIMEIHVIVVGVGRLVSTIITLSIPNTRRIIDVAIRVLNLCSDHESMLQLHNMFIIEPKSLLESPLLVFEQSLSTPFLPHNSHRLGTSDHGSTQQTPETLPLMQTIVQDKTELQRKKQKMRWNLQGV